MTQRALITSLASKHKLPAVYGNPSNINNGGLAFYGPDRIDQFRRAAEYVDRILKGEKAAELPVHVPTKYHFITKTKAAKVIGLALPRALLARADEVIE
ncbi:MAG: ABC transporter substrate binding protein [Bradyrhizobium sp.]